jgi:hypothetical protein
VSTTLVYGDTLALAFTRGHPALHQVKRMKRL